MTDKTQPTAHAEITAPISADLRGMPGLSEQDAELLEQAASMLEGLQNDERNRGNCSTAEGAACSAHAVRRLAVQLLQAAPPAPAAVAVPTPIAAGMRAAAGLVQEQADLYIAEHAETDPDTGAVIWHHLEHGFDWHNGLEELAQKLLARAALAAAPARASDTESVLIDGIAYEVPAAVAGELLSLHLDLLTAAPAQAVAVPQVITDAMILAAWSAAAPERAGDITPFHAAEMKAILAAGIAAAPAQEHATQLAGQGQWKEQGYVSSTHYAEDMQAVGEALMDAIEDNYAALQAAGWGRGIDSPAEIVADLLNLLVVAKAAPAQAQEDARDLEAEALRACRDLPEGWDIVIHLEKGSGSVVLIDPEFNESDMALDGSLFDALKESIAQAVQAGAARAAQGGAA